MLKIDSIETLFDKIALAVVILTSLNFAVFALNTLIFRGELSLIDWLFFDVLNLPFVGILYYLVSGLFALYLCFKTYK